MSLRIEGTLEPTIIRRLKENISDRDNIMLHMGELAIIMILASVYIHKTLIPDHGWTVSLAKHVGYNHIMLQHQPKYPKYCMDCMWHMVCPVQMLNSQLLSARSDRLYSSASSVQSTSAGPKSWKQRVTWGEQASVVGFAE